MDISAGEREVFRSARVEIENHLLGCSGCPNFSTCRRLQSEISVLEHDLHKAYRFSEVFAKRARILVDHVINHQFLFPFVKDYKKCWYYGRSNEVNSLAAYAQRLQRVHAA